MKNFLLTLGTVTLLTSPALFAVEDSLQEHLRMEQKLKQQEQKRLKDGSGSANKHQYKYQNQHQYKGTSPSRSNTGSMGGQRSGGGGRK
jgi:opacity protein-like surface antigen